VRNTQKEKGISPWLSGTTHTHTHKDECQPVEPADGFFYWEGELKGRSDSGCRKVGARKAALIAELLNCGHLTTSGTDHGAARALSYEEVQAAPSRDRLKGRPAKRPPTAGDES
jgi:hypothetical protein